MNFSLHKNVSLLKDDFFCLLSLWFLGLEEFRMDLALGTYLMMKE